MSLRFAFIGVCVLLMVAPLAAAQETGNVQYGSWTATAGAGQVFRGGWSAETRRPNEARGSWTLISDGGDVVMQGTWSARRIAAHWQGTWKATTQQGQTFAGSWDADLAEGKYQTLADMLKLTIENQVAGWWKSGAYKGNWWLKGDKPRK